VCVCDKKKNEWLVVVKQKGNPKKMQDWGVVLPFYKLG
jgi:hypothetical protein